MPMPQPHRGVDPNHNAKMMLQMVPESVRKSASNAELARRINEAQKLAAQATDLSLDPLYRRQSRDRATAVLAAPLPRATQPRRPAPVTKAKAKPKDPDDAPVPVFDADGNLVGIADPADIIEVAGAAKPKPQQSTDMSPAQAAQAITDAGNVPDDEVQKALMAAGAARVYKQGSKRPVLALKIRGAGSVRKEKASDVIARARGQARPHLAPVRKAAPKDDPVRVCNRRGVMVGVTRQSAIRPVPRDTTSTIAKAALAPYVNVYNSAGRRVGIVARDEVRIVKPGR